MDNRKTDPTGPKGLGYGKANNAFMKAVTQNNRILAALKSGQKLTPLDALRRFSCFRLGARVWDLRQAGHSIKRQLVKRGEARVAEYRM